MVLIESRVDITQDSAGTSPERQVVDIVHLAGLVPLFLFRLSDCGKCTETAFNKVITSRNMKEQISYL